jgi:hypothetical protein
MIHANYMKAMLHFSPPIKIMTLEGLHLRGQKFQQLDMRYRNSHTVLMYGIWTKTL